MPRSAGIRGVDAAALDELAAANRVLADLGVFDAAGHVSMRHPGDPKLFLMSRALAPAQVTAADIMAFDLDCNAQDARGRSGFIERYIHGEIYKVRPDVMAVVHSHSPSVIPFSLTRAKLRPMYHNAAFLGAGVPIFDIRKKFGATDIVISSAAKGAALAATLADKSVALLRAHGMVVVAPNLPVAVFRGVYTEVNARIQQNALALGGPVMALDMRESALADEVNLATYGRAWNLWKTRAMAQ